MPANPLSALASAAEGSRELSDADMAEITLLMGGTFHFERAWLSTRPDLADAGSAAQMDAYALVPHENLRVRFWWAVMDVAYRKAPCFLGWTYRRWVAARDANILSRFGAAALRAREAAP